MTTKPRMLWQRSWRGKLWHLVEGGNQYTTAFCGYRPSQRAYGWMESALTRPRGNRHCASCTNYAAHESIP